MTPNLKKEPYLGLSFRIVFTFSFHRTPDQKRHKNENNYYCKHKILAINGSEVMADAPTLCSSISYIFKKKVTTDI